MRYILRIIYVEYVTILRDPAVYLVFLAGLAIYSAFYPYPYSSEVLKEVPVVPVDQDRTMTSQKLMRWADATEEIALMDAVPDLKTAEQLVLSGEAGGIFLIPEGFEHKILRGERTTVSAYANASYFMLYRQVISGLYKASATLSAGIEIRRYTATGLGEQHARKLRDPLPIITRPLFNPVGGYGTYVIPAILILIMQQTLLMGIGIVGGTRNEKFCGTHSQPEKEYSPMAVLVGQTLAYFSIYMLYPLFYLAVIFRSYGLPYTHNPLTTLIFIVPFVLAVTLLGLALNMLFKDRETAIPVILFTSLAVVFLMGYAWPNEAIPGWLVGLAKLLPTTSGSVGFVRVNQMGATLHQVRTEWFTLWSLCALYGVLAWLGLFRKRDGGNIPANPTNSDTVADFQQT